MKNIPPAPTPKRSLPQPKNAAVVQVDNAKYYLAENISVPFYFPGGEQIPFERIDNLGGIQRGVFTTADPLKITFMSRNVVGKLRGVKEISRGEFEARAGRQVRAKEHEFKLKPERTFYHSGDFGDLIYALPTIKRLGGGKLYLGPEIRLSRQTRTRESMSPAKVDMIYDLLRCQDYIDDVIFAQNYPEVRYDLNTFREFCMTFQSGDYQKREGFVRTYSLSEIHLLTFDLDRGDETMPWLSVDAPWEVEGKPIVIHRSHRYHNDAFPWRRLVEKHGEQMVFVGLKAEHDDFIRTFGYVEFFYADNLLELARVIAGAKVYIGNQSCPYAIAEGLKKNTIQETWLIDPNCVFNRPNAIFAKTSEVEIPSGWLK
jgi:hypothetical protein